MKIVQGIDNLIFISILANKLPEDQRDKVRQTGILLALRLRLGLLDTITWIARLTEPVITVFDRYRPEFASKVFDAQTHKGVSRCRSFGMSY
ncbi:hypothetical protein PI87_25680 [Ralstonia sp. A12]|nr:hypothetical protein PI87_25680 [Ralstonia sp. A12]